MPSEFSLNTIYYTITPADPCGHLFAVNLIITRPGKNGQQVSLPNWIPGSYLIRDFSKHIINLQAETLTGKRLSIKPVKKSTWEIEPCSEAVKVSYQVYAWDLSVRGSHFDQSHAFFNGTSVFMAVEEQREFTCQVAIKTSKHSETENWSIATTLPPISINSKGFGEYQATNYKDLIEYPVEMGSFLELNFTANNLPHKIVFTGNIERNKIDKDRLIQDLTAICEVELNLFFKPYPIKHFLFQVMVTENGYGGLEHLDSTALMCSRSNLPYLSDEKPSEDYLQFLELCSHEYFHIWNVKRIQPEVYQTTDLSQPVYTNQLWWFEGITSFYDGLILNMAGIISNEEYLNRLAKEMTRVYRMPGRFKQSVAESSFLTWTKFYQQDENAPNAIISYYTKGSLIALGLDLKIRFETQNKKSLTDILLYLWKNYGQTKQGLKEGEIEGICSQVSGVALQDFFNDFLYGKKDLPFESLFNPFGINFTLRPATDNQDKGGQTESSKFPVNLGVNLVATEHQTLKITHVWESSSSYKAGLAVGDEIIAINQYRMINIKDLEVFLSHCSTEEKIICHFFRRDELKETLLTLQSPLNDRVVLSFSKSSNDKLEWLKNV